MAKNRKKGGKRKAKPSKGTRVPPPSDRLRQVRPVMSIPAHAQLDTHRQSWMPLLYTQKLTYAPTPSYDNPTLNALQSPQIPGQPRMVPQPNSVPAQNVPPQNLPPSLSGPVTYGNTQMPVTPDRPGYAQSTKNVVSQAGVSGQSLEEMTANQPDFYTDYVDRTSTGSNPVDMNDPAIKEADISNLRFQEDFLSLDPRQTSRITQKYMKGVNELYQKAKSGPSYVSQ